MIIDKNCKYCDYLSKCSRKCEYDSILCKINRSFPKIVDKSYEELKKENQKYKEVIDKLDKLTNIRLLTMYFEDGGEISVLPYEDILDILKEVNK